MTTILEIPLRNISASAIEDLQVQYPNATLRIEAESGALVDPLMLATRAGSTSADTRACPSAWHWKNGQLGARVLACAIVELTPQVSFKDRRVPA
jgi:hypothetical protein